MDNDADTDENDVLEEIEESFSIMNTYL